MGRTLGHPCAIVSSAVRPVSTLSRPAHWCAQRHRAMPIQSERQRALLTRIRNAIIHAQSVGTPSRHALWRAQRHRPCPSSPNAIAPCSLACGTSSPMPIQPQRHRGMPTGVRNAISQRSGWPNRRLQRTALRAREIRAFLKAESVQVHFRSIGAPPLKRNTFGGGG